MFQHMQRLVKQRYIKFTLRLPGGPLDLPPALPPILTWRPYADNLGLSLLRLL